MTGDSATTVILEDGDYVLHELVASEGYHLSTDLLINVKNGKVSDKNVAMISEKITTTTAAAAVTTTSTTTSATTSAVTTTTDVKEILAGDVNSYNAVNLKDVVLIRRYIAGGWGITL